MTQTSLLQRRRNCRSLCIDAFEAKGDRASLEPGTEPAQFHALAESDCARLEGIISKLEQTLPANGRSHTQTDARARRRQCRTESSSIIPLTSREEAHKYYFVGTNCKKGIKPTSSLRVASDAHVQLEGSTNLLCSQPHHVPDEPEKHETKVIEAILTQAKHPAQAEWEQLWYHSTVAAYQNIAHSFPDLSSIASSPTFNRSVAEPTLDISSLNKEDQAIFRKEERPSHEPFAPKSEEDRVHRQRRAAENSDQRQKIALLLGLPTFEEYIEQKRQVQEQLCQDTSQPSKRQLKRLAKFAEKNEQKRAVKVQQAIRAAHVDEGYFSAEEAHCLVVPQETRLHQSMTHENSQAASRPPSLVGGAEHRPLVVGLTKPPSSRSASTMASSSDAAALNKEIAENVKENTTEAAPTPDNPSAPTTQKAKKEKAPKQPKPQKAAAPSAPTSPALIDLRVGHILRAIAHPNADSLYVSTIAMGDPEGAEHTQVDEETGKVVRTVCSGLNGLVPLEDMQGRKVIVVANLKPVNMRSIKSAAMVLAASPKQPEGADPHAADRVVELVSPPEGTEAGDKVYFEGWEYGEGKGPEKQLNPKKKQWEAIQPGFYTSDDLVVAFDAAQCEEVEGAEKGNLVVAGKGACKVKTLQGAVVR